MWKSLPDTVRVSIFFQAVSVAVVFLALCIAHANLLNDPDTLWHTELGRGIVQSGHLASIDKYSHTYRGAPFVEVEWLSQVLLYLANWAYGWRGTTLLAIATLSFTAWFAHLAFSEFVKPMHACLVTIVAMFASSTTFLARPHIFGIAVLAVWTWRTFGAAVDKRAPDWWLLALFYVWVSLHPSYILGLIIAGFAFLDYALETRLADRRTAARWILFFTLCAILYLFNPNGLQPLLIGLHVGSMNNALSGISEWAPFTVSSNVALTLMLFSILALLTICRPELPVARVAFALFTLFMFLRHVRFAYVFFLLMPIAVMPFLSRQFPVMSKTNWLNENRDAVELFIARRFLAVMFLFVSAAVAGTAFVVVSNPKPAPERFIEDAMAFVKSQGDMGNVFNSYDFGGTLIYNGIPTFVDGRTDQLFLGEFWGNLQDTFKATGQPAFEEILRRYDIGWTLLRPDGPQNGFLSKMPGWSRIYEDSHAVIYVKSNTAKGKT